MRTAEVSQKTPEGTQDAPGGAGGAEGVQGFMAKLKALDEAGKRLEAMGISPTVKDNLRKRGFEVW